MDRTVSHFAICHCAVDFACVSTMLATAAPFLGDNTVVSASLAILAYDLVAFCMQLPLGIVLDCTKHPHKAALISFALVIAGVLCSLVKLPIFMLMAIVLVALGNALFHCAGGKDILELSHDLAAPSGIFISTGALGVFFGARSLRLLDAALEPVLIALMAICALLVLWLDIGPREDRAFVPPALPTLTSKGLASVCLLAITVALRSYTGMVMAFPWKGEFVLAVIAIVAVVLGKATGGIVADKLGLFTTSVVSLGVSAFLFLFAWQSPIAGIIATFLFNFTMPITLISLARLMPLNHGFAFGIASFSLAIGAAPAFMGWRVTSGGALCVLSIASLVALALGLRLAFYTE